MASSILFRSCYVCVYSGNVTAGSFSSIFSSPVSTADVWRHLCVEATIHITPLCMLEDDQAFPPPAFSLWEFILCDHFEVFHVEVFTAGSSTLVPRHLLGTREITPAGFPRFCTRLKVVILYLGYQKVTTYHATFLVPLRWIFCHVIFLVSGYYSLYSYVVSIPMYQ